MSILFKLYSEKLKRVEKVKSKKYREINLDLSLAQGKCHLFTFQFCVLIVILVDSVQFPACRFTPSAIKQTLIILTFINL